MRSPEAVLELSAYQDAPPQPAPAAWLSETETRPIVAVNSAAAAAVLIFAGVKLAIPSVKTLG